jgi:hypothetical protein
VQVLAPQFGEIWLICLNFEREVEEKKQPQLEKDEQEEKSKHLLK